MKQCTRYQNYKHAPMLTNVGLVPESKPAQPPTDKTTSQGHQIEQKLRHAKAKLFDPCKPLVYPIEKKRRQVDVDEPRDVEMQLQVCIQHILKCYHDD